MRRVVTSTLETILNIYASPKYGRVLPKTFSEKWNSSEMDFLVTE